MTVSKVLAGQDRIAVTAMGAITPVGIGVDEYWSNLIAGECGIGEITRFDASGLAVRIAAEVRGFNARAYLPKELVNKTDLFTQFAFAAASEALAGCSSGPSILEDPGLIKRDRIGIVLGTAMAGISTTASTQDRLTKAVHKNVGPRFVPRILGNIAAAHIAISCGITGPSITISTACASGNDAIIEGLHMIESDDADAVLVVGTESILSPIVIYSLANAKALSRRNDDPAHASKPFDAGRDGFVIGEGGGAVVLERESQAIRRGADIHGVIAGWAHNNDAYKVIAPEPNSKMSIACMRKALERACMQPEDVSYVNAHGTSTQLGDETEANAIAAVFDGCAPKVSSTKGATGHMMGAGGITEVIACIKAVQTGVLPPNINLEKSNLPIDIVTVAEKVDGVKAAMSNAFGFGGQNSCIVVESA